MPQKTLITKLYQERANGDKNTRTLAHLIHSVEIDTLSGSRYINELLQNADDAGKELKEELSVDFVLTNNYLVFSHNGKPFDQEDVEGIADAASPARKKAVDSDSIGNKGIGFKSVFTIADYVLILSNKYSFRFDEKHDKWKNNSRDYPWEIIPIWTEHNEIPSEVVKLINPNKVNFVFKIRDVQKREEITKDLEKLVSNSKYLIFLRKLKHISFENMCRREKKIKLSLQPLIEDNKNENKEEKDKNQTFAVKRLNATLNDIQIESWYLYSKVCPLPEQVKAIISKSTTIPLKYRNTKSVNISLAIQHSDKGICTSEFPTVFCYLPTEINHPASFYINADFLLDTARAQFQNNTDAMTWNNHLFRLVYCFQFEFIQFISQNTNLWPYVAKMILNPDRIVESQLVKHKDTLNKDFEKGLNQYYIITNLGNNSVSTVKSSHYDPNKFIETFGTPDQKSTCMSYLIEQPGVFVGLGTKTFNIDDVIQSIKTVKFIDSLKKPAMNLQLIVYMGKLYKYLKASEQTTDIKKLKDLFSSTALILSTNNVLKRTSDVFFPQETLKYIPEKFSFIDLIHKIINQKVSTEEDVRIFLNAMGVKQLTFAHVIDKANESVEQIVPFTKAIYDRKLEQKEEEHLKRLKVKTKDAKINSSTQCYLSDKYQPELPIENYLDDLSSFLSEEYLSGEEDKEKIGYWRKFFIQIGVKTNLDKDNLKIIVTHANKKESGLVAFTRLLFKYFYKDKDDKEQGCFSKDIAQLLSTLKLRTTNNKYYDINDCYLSSAYEPEMKLESSVPALNYVSKKYIEQKEDSILWKRFFNAIGVKSEIRLKMLAHVCRTSVPNGQFQDYITFLDNHTHEIHEPLGTRLCPPETMYYPSQHHVSHFFSIDYFDALANTPLFWEVISRSWDEIKNTGVKYATRYSDRKIPSNIEYFVIRIVKEIYQATPEELYSPCIRSIFSDEDLSQLKIADIVSSLTNEQIAFFRFKQVLTPSDCLYLLKKLSTQEFSQSTLKKITYLYNEITKVLQGKTLCFENTAVSENKENKGTNAGNFLLLSQTGKFVPADKLYGLVSEIVQLSEENDFLFKRPEAISLNQFKILCQSLQINTINDEDLELSLVSEIENPSFKKHIFERLPYLLLIESYKKDILKTDLKYFIPKLLLGICKKLNDLQYISARKICVSYKNVFSQEVDSWFDPKRFTLIYPENLEASDLRTICGYFCNYLGLNVDIDTFWNILLFKDEEIVKKYKSYNLSEESITYVRTLINSPDALNAEMKLLDITVAENSSLAQNSNSMDEDKSDGVEQKEIKYANEGTDEKLMCTDLLQDEPGELEARKSSSYNLNSVPMQTSSSSVVNFSNENPLHTELYGQGKSNETKLDLVSAKQQQGKEELISTGLSPETRKRKNNETKDAINVQNKDKQQKIKPPGKIKELDATDTRPSVKNDNLSFTEHPQDVPPMFTHPVQSLALSSTRSLSFGSSSSSNSSSSSSSYPLTNTGESSDKPLFSSRVFSLSKQKPHSSHIILKDEEKIRIGKDGEQKVYDFLKEKYQNKYGPGFEETSIGFVLKKNGCKKQVEWCNKHKESGNHYDFIVKKFDKNNKLIKTRYIEVKSTLKKGEIEMNFSVDEWNMINIASKEPTSSYGLYCVSNLTGEKNDWKVIKVKDFCTKLNSQEVQIRDIKRVRMSL